MAKVDFWECLGHPSSVRCESKGSGGFGPPNPWGLEIIVLTQRDLSLLYQSSGYGVGIKGTFGSLL